MRRKDKVKKQSTLVNVLMDKCINMYRHTSLCFFDLQDNSKVNKY